MYHRLSSRLAACAAVLCLGVVVSHFVGYARVKDETWVPTGLASGTLPGPVTEILAAPGDAGRLLARSGNDLYHTVNGGAEWAAVSGLVDRPVNMVRHPTNPQWLVAVRVTPAAVTAGLLRSSDGGQTWQVIPGSDSLVPTVSSLAFSSDGSYLFLAPNWMNTIYRSADNGTTWQTVLTDTELKPGLWCSPVTPTRCLSGSHVTDDAGTTWQPLTAPTGFRELSAAAFSASAPATLYALAPWDDGYRLLISTSGGQSFDFVATTMRFDAGQHGKPPVLWVNPVDARSIVLASGGNLVRSADGGATFSQLSAPAASDIRAPAVFLTDAGFNGTTNSRAWVGSTYGVFRTDNVTTAGPGDWIPLSEGLGGSGWLDVGPLSADSRLMVGHGELAVVSLSAPVPQRVLTRGQSGGGLDLVSLDPTGPYVYGTVGARLVRTEIPSGTVQDLPLPEPDFTIGSLAASGNVLYVASSLKLFRTLAARSPAPAWELVYELPPGGPGGGSSLTSIGFALGQARTLTYTLRHHPPLGCCPVSVGLVRDADSVTPSLAVIATGSPSRTPALTVATADGRIMYRTDVDSITQIGTFYRSDDGGANWQSVDLPSAVRHVLPHPKNPDWLFSRGSDARLYRSENGGLTWTASDLPSTTPGTLSWWGTKLLFNIEWLLDVPGRPSLWIDAPAPTGLLRQPFQIVGWAVDPADASGTGVDAVQAYAYPQPGSGLPPLFVGTARYGDARPDVAATLGDPRFSPSGFALSVDGLASGRYEFVVYEHSTFDGRFVARTFTADVTDGPLSVDPLTMRFAAVRAGATGSLTSMTSPQTATVRFRGTGVGWTVSSDASWLQIEPASGTGNGTFQVSLSGPLSATPSITTMGATITVTPVGGLPVARLPVTLVVYPEASTHPPFGQVDTPEQDALDVSGAIGVTGWALDDIDVAGVGVYRECLPFDVPASCQLIDGRSLVFIGDAARTPGTRPDVAAAFPGAPAATRAGWGLHVLTRMLPDVPRQLGTGGQGPLSLFIVATDAEGRRRFLGRTIGDDTPTRIVMDNDNAARPFGVIDTPAQGATVSGVVAISGWVLTPDLNTTADGTDILVPTGAAITLFVDGIATGTATYGQCRGTAGPIIAPDAYCDDDVASAFGHATPMPPFTPRTTNPTRFRNLDAGRGAIASMTWDTTTVPDGWHSIAWSVTDSAGRTEGIGSRNVYVNNATPGAGDRR